MQKVSILIPVYNTAEYLAETLESCLAQTYGNIEIVVVDDGSTDDSLAVAKRYESERLKVYHQENSGACAARNFAFAVSTGDYIQYLDSDDTMTPDKIERQMALLANEDEHTVSFCGVEGWQQRFIFKDYDDPKKLLTDMWERREDIAIHQWLTPRILIEKAGLWNREITLNDDGEFFCRVLLTARKVVFCNNNAVFYRVREGSLSHSRRTYKHQKSLLTSFHLYEKILEKEDTIQIRSALAVNYANYILKYADLYPDLTEQAYGYLRKLGVKIPDVANRPFKIVRFFVGFRNAVNLRLAAKKFVSKLYCILQ